MADVQRVRLRSGIQTVNGITGETGPLYSEYVLAEHYDALRAERDELLVFREKWHYMDSVACNENESLLAELCEATKTENRLRDSCATGAETIRALRARVAELEAAGRAVLECNDKACMMTTRCPAQCQADQNMRAVLRASTKPVPGDDLAALTSLASMLDTIKSQDWAECWSEHDQGLRDWLTQKLREAYAARESTGPRQVTGHE